MAQLNLIILGLQGSGKGTQAKFLAEKYGVERIEVGDLLRELAQSDSVLGRRVDRLINKKGELAPFNIVLNLIKERIQRLPEDQGFILDGAPRALDEAIDEEKLLVKFNRPISKVIYLDIPVEETMARLSKRRTCKKCDNPLILGVDVQSDQDKCPACGGEIYQRQDDTPVKIHHRLEIYNKETLPVVDYFRKKGILLEVDGVGGIEEVFERIIKKMEL